MAKVGEKQNEFFSRFIADRRILVADTNASSRAGLAKTMIDLGAKMSNVTFASNYAIAEAEIQRAKPDVVVCDYDLGKRCGLELLQKQRAQHPDSRRTLFILVTGNTSQSAVAQAAEEDIDAYILKPYTVEVLRNSIIRAALLKIIPPAYLKTIEDGKILMADGKIDEAITKFEAAKAQDPKPALACFYIGQAWEIKKTLETAEGSYNEGLNLSKIHYRCMTGLFDLMVKRQESTKAYEIVKRIVRYFPANPQRLNTVLRLAIITQSFEDIERYYQAFIELDERNDELIRHVCAALVICGKFYLQGNLPRRAIELFQKAAATGSGRIRVLKEIVLALTANGQAKVAEEFLKKFPAESQTSPEYHLCEYAVANQTITPSLAIDKGRELIAQGVHDPIIYRILIERCREANLNDGAEKLAHEAANRYPELKEEFLASIA